MHTDTVQWWAIDKIGTHLSRYVQCTEAEVWALEHRLNSEYKLTRYTVTDASGMDITMLAELGVPNPNLIDPF